MSAYDDEIRDLARRFGVSEETMRLRHMIAIRCGMEGPLYAPPSPEVLAAQEKAIRRLGGCAAVNGSRAKTTLDALRLSGWPW